jgi:cytochrome b involved in lipid metabolism
MLLRYYLDVTFLRRSHVLSLVNTTTHAFLVLPGGPKVFDVTKYLDDHPGGAEVMLDVAGQNADEFFEDIGHSKEAREELKKYYIGDFKLDENALAAMKAAAEAKKNEGSGKGLILVLLVAIIAILFGVYQTQMK